MRWLSRLGGQGRVAGVDLEMGVGRMSGGGVRSEIDATTVLLPVTETGGIGTVAPAELLDDRRIRSC